MKEGLANIVLELETQAETSFQEPYGFEVKSVFSSKENLASEKTTSINKVIVGRLVEIGISGEPLVDFPDNLTGKSLSSLTTVALSKNDVGRELVLIFEDGDSNKPIIIGLLQARERFHSMPETMISYEEDMAEIIIDGEKLVFSAKQEIVIRCGKASITLTRSGKVVINGTYLLNKSSGVNRIKGGSVQIN